MALSERRLSLHSYGFEVISTHSLPNRRLNTPFTNPVTPSVMPLHKAARLPHRPLPPRSRQHASRHCTARPSAERRCGRMVPACSFAASSKHAQQISFPRSGPERASACLPKGPQTEPLRRILAAR